MNILLSKAAMTSRPVTYIRNRQRKQFNWTNKLNKDLLECYNKACDDSSMCYMDRIKRYWDIKHPELNQFTAKNLRDHADCIKKKQVVMTTESLNNVSSTNSVNGVTCENIGTDKEITPESTKTIADKEIRSEETPRDNIKEQLILLFNKNLESFKSKPLELRHNTTRINKKLDEKVISTINDICGEALQSLSNIDYWDINYIIYCAAITCKEFNNDVISSSQKPTNERNQTPKWITQLEASITNTRRTIAQLEVVQ